MAEPIRVAIVDDHPLFREGLVETIKTASNLVVVAEAGSADEVSHVVLQSRPDVLLLDIFIPGGGIQAARAMQQARVPVRVVMLTASDDGQHVCAAIEAGAKGYILKSVSGLELIRAVECVYAGASYITPELAARLLMQTKGKPLLADQNDLTVYELKILGHLTTGLTNQEIAASIGLNLRTTKRCLSKIFRKLGVRNRVEAVLATQKLNLSHSR